jgi:hypothetical protein
MGCPTPLFGLPSRLISSADFHHSTTQLSPRISLFLFLVIFSLPHVKLDTSLLASFFLLHPSYTGNIHPGSPHESSRSHRHSVFQVHCSSTPISKAKILRHIQPRNSWPISDSPTTALRNALRLEGQAPVRAHAPQSCSTATKVGSKYPLLVSSYK